MKVMKNKSIKTIRNLIVSIYRRYRVYIFSKIYKNHSIFDYEFFCYPRFDYYNNYGTRDLRQSYIIYGVSYSIRKYAEYDRPLKMIVEHGMPLLGFNPKMEDYNRWDTVLVSSQMRAQVVEDARNNKNRIIPIGPYIHYAKCLYSDFEMKNIKRTLGKTLLVLPDHSAESYSSISNRNQDFIDYIHQIEKKYNYDTVIICIYYLDLKYGLDLQYKKEGWQIVTAGLQENYDFLYNLKTIICIADHVLIQGFSPSIGYAIYLGVPVTCFDKKEDYEYINEEEKSENALYRIEDNDSIYSELLKRLGQYSETIEGETYSYVASIWGFENIKTPLEMKKICKSCKINRRFSILKRKY